MNNKIILIFAVFIGLLAISPGVLGVCTSDSTFSNQKNISVAVSGSATANQQVRITVDTASEVTAGNMQSDMDDIKFYNLSGTVIPHWIENNTRNTANTQIWIKIPTALSTTNTNITMCYGNSSKTNIENIYNVAQIPEAADDFPGTTVNTTTWTSIPQNGAFYVSNGMLLAQDNSSANNPLLKTAALNLSAVDFWIYNKAEALNYTSGTDGYGHAIWTSAEAQLLVSCWRNISPSSLFYSVYSGSATDVTWTSGVNFTSGTWYYMNLTTQYSTFTQTFNANRWLSGHAYQSSANSPSKFVFGGGSGAVLLNYTADYIFNARNYTGTYTITVTNGTAAPPVSYNSFTVTLNNPGDSSTNSSGNITFAYTPDLQNTSLQSCRLDLKVNSSTWTSNSTNASNIINATQNYITVNGITEGTGSGWTVVCTNATSTVTATNRTFGVSVNPSVTLNQPTDGASVSSLTVIFNWTPSDYGKYFRAELWTNLTIIGSSALAPSKLFDLSSETGFMVVRDGLVYLCEGDGSAGSSVVRVFYPNNGTEVCSGSTFSKCYGSPIVENDYWYSFSSTAGEWYRISKTNCTKQATNSLTINGAAEQISPIGDGTAFIQSGNYFRRIWLINATEVCNFNAGSTISGASYFPSIGVAYLQDTAHIHVVNTSCSNLWSVNRYYTDIASYNVPAFDSDHNLVYIGDCNAARTAGTLYVVNHTSHAIQWTMNKTAHCIPSVVTYYNDTVVVGWYKDLAGASGEYTAYYSNSTVRWTNTTKAGIGWKSTVTDGVYLYQQQKMDSPYSLVIRDLYTGLIVNDTEHCNNIDYCPTPVLTGGYFVMNCHDDNNIQGIDVGDGTPDDFYPYHGTNSAGYDPTTLHSGTNTTNWTIVATNSSAITNNSINSISYAFSEYLSHVWNVKIFDTLGNSAFAASNFTFSMAASDTTPPNTTIVSPTNTTYSTGININVTTSEAASTCLYSLSSGVNYTLFNSSPTNWYNVNQTVMINATTYNLFVYCNDTAGNMGLNTSLWFTYSTSTDVTPPTVTIVSPANTTYNSGINVNFTTSEDSVWCFYNLNGGTNYSLSNSSKTNWYTINQTVLVNATTYQLIGYCADITGNVGSNSVYFTYSTSTDVTPPVVTIASPANTSYSTNININFTSSESVAWCRYNLNDGTNYTLSNSSMTNWYTVNQTVMVNATTYRLRGYCSDLSGNVGSSSVYFTYLTSYTPPPSYTLSIVVVSPTNTTYSSTINLNVTTNATADKCLFNVGSTNYTLFNSSTTNWYTTISGLSNATTYNLKVYCNTTDGNFYLNNSIWFTYLTSSIGNKLLIYTYDATSPSTGIKGVEYILTTGSNVKTISTNKTNTTSSSINASLVNGNLPYDGDFLTYSNAYMSAGTGYLSGSVQMNGKINVRDSNQLCFKGMWNMDGGTITPYLLLEDTLGTYRTLGSVALSSDSSGTYCFSTGSYTYPDFANARINISFTRANDYLFMNISILEVHNKYNWMTNGINISSNDLYTGTTEIQVTDEADNYYPSKYFMSTSLSTNTTLNTYLIPKTSSVVQPTFIVKNTAGSYVSNVTLSAQSLINSTYVTIEQALTDDTGSTTMYLINMQNYRIVLTYGNTVNQYNIIAQAQEYDFLINQSIDVNVSSTFSDIYIRVNPSTINYNASLTTYPVNFNYSVISNDSLLNLYGMELFCNGTSVYSNNVSGSPSGGTMFYVYDIFGCDNATLRYYFLKGDGTFFSRDIPYQISKNYIYGMWEAMTLLKNGYGSGITTFVVIIILTLLGAGLSLFSRTGAAIACCIAGGAFVWAGLFPWGLYLVEVLAIGALTYLNQRWN